MTRAGSRRQNAIEGREAKKTNECNVQLKLAWSDDDEKCGVIAGGVVKLDNQTFE